MRNLFALFVAFSFSLLNSHAVEAIRLFGDLNFGDAKASVETKLRVAAKVEIGKFEYSIVPEFEEGKLVAISLLGKSGPMSDYRDTVVKAQHDDMRIVLQAGYGKEIPVLPDNEFGTAWEQVRLNVPQGYTKFTYIYRKDGKVARLGLTHGEYREFSLLVDIRSIKHEAKREAAAVAAGAKKF
jgi:hypothetical protein